MPVCRTEPPELSGAGADGWTGRAASTCGITGLPRDADEKHPEVAGVGD